MLRVGYELARQRRSKLTSVDKANVLATSQLWRRIAQRMAAENAGRARPSTQLVDSCAMHLLRRPRDFDVLVMENLFGDILTDEAAALAGSLGVMPSASLGDGRLGVYEPIHGTAPDIAGKGIANPLGSILSAAMLLRHSLDLDAEARRGRARRGAGARGGLSHRRPGAPRRGRDEHDGDGRRVVAASVAEVAWRARV